MTAPIAPVSEEIKDAYRMAGLKASVEAFVSFISVDSNRTLPNITTEIMAAYRKARNEHDSFGSKVLPQDVRKAALAARGASYAIDATNNRAVDLFNGVAIYFSDTNGIARKAALDHIKERIGDNQELLSYADLIHKTSVSLVENSRN